MVYAQAGAGQGHRDPTIVGSILGFFETGFCYGVQAALKLTF